MAYSEAELDLIDRTEEVDIETNGPDGAVHRTTIWAIVDDGDVFVRSYRGPQARWYREALADPSAALHVDGQRLPVRVAHAADADSIERTSAGILRKYVGDPAAKAMVVPKLLDLTLRLERR